MKNTKEENCMLDLCICKRQEQKPELKAEPESKPTLTEFEPGKKHGQMPWTVFKDVYWI